MKIGMTLSLLGGNCKCRALGEDNLVFSEPSGMTGL